MNQKNIEIKKKEEELESIFNSFTEVLKADDLLLVEDIIANIGKVDAEIEGLREVENQRDLSIKFHWGHNHRFNEQLIIKGRMGNRHLNLMAQFMLRYNLSIDYFQNKNVIDVGCWTGGTLLLLKALGVNKLLALEEVQKYALVAKRLAQDLYKLDNITCNGTNLFDLKTRDKYDIIYFPGVIYHLSDPVLALRRLFNATKNGGEIFIESMGIDSENAICEFHGNRQHHNADEEDAKDLNRGGWNWFVPSPKCLSLWLTEAGFEDIDCYYSLYSNRVFGHAKRNKYNEITRAGLSLRGIE
jgi:SAM-dependent methyltransferase